MADDRSEGELPVAAVHKLTELKDLAAAALDCWNSGNRKGAFGAVTAAMPAAAAAATALNILLELDHAAVRAEERRHGPTDGGVISWG
ncbi:hypothetical protein [Kitasatospora sp. NPDC085879]|uniref:hypothetical protein n=1 Tax=Kitasatospora sp. NPDC085879 TaxID=3154769 RepID=UPI000BB12FC7|nr:hypothetical protein [Streptomyces sp. TLI_235]PBC69887.1 hypothetical protein BX265_7251 [Streptomyces sp. TLI_235]